MATLVLGTVGSLLGGPLGGALGAFAGSKIDGELFGGSSGEGPRLRDLALTTSAYGQPIARHFGKMRVPGTIIWASDLKENSEEQGGGKGQPAATTYSYSASFAVALSSRPVAAIGRIWADGNLLRGAAGDLKAPGVMRFYSGWGDQSVDPLLDAAIEHGSPAYRHRAYVVFEDLDLSQFGNRIPTLSFEIDGEDARHVVEGLLDPAESFAAGNATFANLGGYSHESGTIAQNLSAIDTVLPLIPEIDGKVMSLRALGNGAFAASLSEPAAWDGGDFGAQDGQSRGRNDGQKNAFHGLRYYDTGRDYQPGLQRVEGGADTTIGRIIEFPGALSSNDARSLAEAAADRASRRADTLTWRCAEIDPAIVPGAIVRAPGQPGLWLVRSWEWREGGVELEMTRYFPEESETIEADSGTVWQVPDLAAQQTVLRVFELPPQGPSETAVANIYAAVGAPAGAWSGAALYAVRSGQLVSVGASRPRRAGLGELVTPLPGSPALLFEAEASCVIGMIDRRMELPSTDVSGLASGANRILVGGEIIQYATAKPLGEGRWELKGLLRGRGGTEIAAAAGHASSAAVTTIDERLTKLEQSLVPLMSVESYAAIGRADEQPVFAAVETAGSSLKPPCPVGARKTVSVEGNWRLEWTRRARGAWRWTDAADVPLIEETENYLVGIGAIGSPVALLTTKASSLELSVETVVQYQSQSPGAPIWVRQIGSHGQSDPLLLAHLPQ